VWLGELFPPFQTTAGPSSLGQCHIPEHMNLNVQASKICQEGMKIGLFWLVHTTTVQHMEAATIGSIWHILSFF
jgi:hypothetical protein